MRATFVYPNSRHDLLARIEDGTEPDSTLLGANHLAGLGVDARIHDPLLSRRNMSPMLTRIAWHLRELTVPFEVGRCDVLVTPLANFVPLAGRIRSLPVVVVNYGLNLIWRRSPASRRALLRRSLRAAACVVCLGESQRQELNESIDLDEEGSKTLLLPIDEVFYSPQPSKAKADTVLTVGKDLARDYATFLAAVRGLDAPVQLAVYPRNLAGLDIPGNARAQVFSSVQLRDAYASAACVVLPQRRDDYAFGSEGGGLTALLEAMAMARPIVATERAILRDYVVDGVEALIVPPEDPTALREAIARVLADPELGERLGSAARARVERDHTTRGFARRLEPLLATVV
jgi:glycosyltransferase involved in cell wall biosynthesis